MRRFDQLKFPPLLKRLMKERSLTIGAFDEKAGTSCHNWLNGHAIPRDAAVIYRGLDLSMPNGEEDEIGRAIQHDRGLRLHQEETYRDKEGAREFSAVFTRVSDVWCKGKDKPLAELARQMDVDPSTLSNWRSGKDAPRNFPILKRALEVIKPKKADQRAMINALFKVRHLGTWEAVEKVIKDFLNIDSSGELLARLRLANLREHSELEKMTQIPKQTLRCYEQGVIGYHAHREVLAEVLVPAPAREAFLATVDRVHGVRSFEQIDTDMDRIFANLEAYHSPKELFKAILDAKGRTRNRAQKESGYNFWEDSIPQPENTVKVIKGLKLGVKHGLVLAARLDEMEEAGKPSRNEARLETIFAGLSEYECFADFAWQVREACGISQEQLAGRYGCVHQNIGQLENKRDCTPHRSVINRWVQALELSEEQIEAIEAFCTSKCTRGDFGVLLGAYLKAHPYIKTDNLAKLAGLSRGTILNITSGISARPQLAKLEAITRSLGFETPAEFFEAARPIAEQNDKGTRTKQNMAHAR